MILVILGAGATYDSDPLRPAGARRQPLMARPPLASELFDQRFNSTLLTHEDCYRLIPRLRSAVKAGTSIELELERIRAEAGTGNPTFSLALTALRGYIGDVVASVEKEWHQGLRATSESDLREGHHGITNQLDLVAQLEEWREREGEGVRFVTFNYDRMLEAAVERAIPGIGFGALETYIGDERYKIYKLHGSIDWFRQTDIVVEAPTASVRQPAPKLQQYFSASPPQLTVGGPEWIRAISIPLATKTDSEFECPEEHLSALRADLPKVDRVISIGWRGEEAHFLRLWEEHRPAALNGVISVAASTHTAFAVYSALTRGKGIPTQPVLLQDGFTHFLQHEDKALKTWLPAA